MLERYKLSLKLPEGFTSEQMESNWADLFMGLPKEPEWEVEVENEEELSWLIADFLAMHEGVLCEMAGVERFEDIQHPETWVDVAPLL